MVTSDTDAHKNNLARVYQDSLYHLLIHSDLRLSPQIAPLVIGKFSDIFTPTLIAKYHETAKNISFTEYVKRVAVSDLYGTHAIGGLLFQRVIEETAHDIENIKNLFPTEINIKRIGDTHAFGASKYKVGNQVINKEFSGWSGLIERLINSVGYDKDYYPFHLNKKRGYMIREYLPAQQNTTDETDIKKFYYNLGKYIPLLLSIRAIDLTHENMLVCLPYPIYFDLETILMPQYSTKTEYNLVKSAFISKNIDESFWNYSSYTGGVLPAQSYLKAVVSGNPYSPHIVWNAPSSKKISNIPYLKGNIVNPFLYRKELMRGFSDGVELLIENKIKLRKLVFDYRAPYRIVLRSTVTYRIPYIKYQFPQVYSVNEDYRKFVFEYLKKQIYILGVSDVSGLLENETETMACGYIPMYYAKLHEDCIYAANGNCVSRLVQKPIHIMKNQLDNLETFLQNERLRLFEYLNENV